MFKFLKKKEVKENTSYLGFYDTKPFHYYSSALIYAKNYLIKEIGENKIYARVYNKTLLIFCLIANENGYNKNIYSYETIEEEIKTKIEDVYKLVVHLTIFENNNEFTIGIAKEKTNNTKTFIEQVLLYNGKKVGLEFYRPVPNFYKIYEDYAVAIWFDLAAIDPLRC